MANYKELLADIVFDCNDYKVSFLLSNEEKVNLPAEEDEFKSSGFFCYESMLLAVGTKKPLEEWFQTLLHEYNHMIQWSEVKYFSGKYTESYDMFWEWLDYKVEFEEKELIEMIDIVREVELDCEKRTWKMIVENPELGMDADKYVKKANVYLYSYTLFRDTRKWYKNPPYLIEEALDLVSNKFVKNYNNVPKGFKELIIDKCF